MNRIITYFPLINSKIRIPSDQQSAAISWPLFKIISGATYSKNEMNEDVEEEKALHTRCTTKCPGFFTQTYFFRKTEIHLNILRLSRK